MGNSKSNRRFKLKYVAIIGIFIYVLSIFVKQQIMINELEEKEALKEDEIKELNNEINEIRGKIQYNHTLEYVEKIARDELGMVKSGEIIFIDSNKNKNKLIKGIKD